MDNVVTRVWLGAVGWWGRRKWLRAQSGTVALEYLLIIGLIVILLFAILYLFMDPIKNMVSQAVSKIKDWLAATNNTGP